MCDPWKQIEDFCENLEVIWRESRIAGSPFGMEFDGPICHWQWHVADFKIVLPSHCGKKSQSLPPDMFRFCPDIADIQGSIEDCVNALLAGSILEYGRFKVCLYSKRMEVLASRSVFPGKLPEREAMCHNLFGRYRKVS